MASELVWSDAPVAKKRRLKLLVLGVPKIGKSVTVAGTAKGRSYIINADQEDSLDHVTEIYPNALFAQDEKPIRTRDTMDRAVYRARKMAVAGEIDTAILDTLTGFSQHLIKEVEEENPDPRKFYPAYTNYIVNLCSRMLDLPCHVIVTSHWQREGGDDDKNRTGPGIVPLLETEKARMRVAGLFNDVVFYEKRKSGRVFATDIQGVWGPGCRSIAKMPATPIKANIKTLMRHMGILPPRNKEAA